MAEGMVENKTQVKQLNQAGKKKATFPRTKRQGCREKKQEEQKRLKDLETSIRSQVAAEENAHKIVEKLVLEDEISEEFLQHSGNFITTSHYEDVVEERMIAQKCGYPVCKNQLSQIPSQKYKISLRTNRVYDITERKCFCSNFCFKASKFFESQISDSPVWTRIGESLKTFVLLDTEDSTKRTGAGKVLLGKDEEQENASVESRSERWEDSGEDDFKGRSDNMPSQDDEREIYKYRLADSIQDLTRDNSSEKGNQEHSVCDINGGRTTCLPTNDDNQESCAENTTFTSGIIGGYCIRNDSLSRETIVESVRAVFQEWCTLSTLEYLGLSDDKTTTGTRLPEKREKDPDSFTARAARFFQPVVSASEDCDSDSDAEENSNKTQEVSTIKERQNLEPMCILPPIDSKSQTTIRRRIVLDKLFRVLPDLLSEIKLTVGEVSRDLTQLVHTFSLSNKNVSLKPLQWKILALALMVILQKKNSLLLQAMESLNNEFDSLLSRLALSRQDIDQVLSSLKPLHSENSDNFEKENTSESSYNEDKVVPDERKDFGDMEELD